MLVKRIVERVIVPFTGATVDLAAGVIRGVKLCGSTSANGRDYPPEVFRRGVQKYEGVAIYADHGRERSVDRKIGWIESPRVDVDGTPRGDAHLLKSHPLYAQVMEAAQRNPTLYGFSHVATCETSYAGGRERVEELQTIESVDLVAEPATTRGLFEMRCEERKNVMGFTVKDLVEWVASHPNSTTADVIRAKKLSEMDDAAYADSPLTTDAALTAETDPADAITDGFRAAIRSLVEQALEGTPEDKTRILKKIKSLLAAHGDATGSASSDALPGDKPESESRTRAAADHAFQILEALDACDRAGFRPDRSDLDLIALAPADRRAPLVAKLKKASESTGGEKPTSAERGRTVKFDETTTDGKSDPPTDGKAFAKWVSE